MELWNHKTLHRDLSFLSLQSIQCNRSSGSCTRSIIFLTVKLHICLFCYLTTQTIEMFNQPTLHHLTTDCRCVQARRPVPRYSTQGRKFFALFKERPPNTHRLAQLHTIYRQVRNKSMTTQKGTTARYTSKGHGDLLACGPFVVTGIRYCDMYKAKLKFC